MDFVVNRQDLRQCRFVPADGSSALAPGQARIRIERFGLTANNVTYGAVGDLMGYWKFFPADDGWGRIPVWGVGVVEAAGATELREGERIYGYFPISTHLVVEPTRVGRHGFVDGTAHRRELPPVYNQYVRLEGDAGYSTRDDDRLMLLRPLFATAFLLDDMIAENDFYGASAVLLASASSKTAFSLAHLLSARKRPGLEVVGLTSPRNLDFVRGLPCYGRAVAYDAVKGLPASWRVVLVDMAGDQRVTRDVHQHFGDGVAYSCQVGLTHWEEGGSVDGLPGAKPEFFFAPSRMEQRTKDWGADGLQSRLASAWRAFLDGTEGWLRVERQQGTEAVERAYLDTLEGRVRPDRGLVLSL